MDLAQRFKVEGLGFRVRSRSVAFRFSPARVLYHPIILQDPIHMWVFKHLNQDNDINLVTVLILHSYVTNLTTVTTQMPTCKTNGIK